MENLKTALSIIVVIAIGWHVKVGFSTDTKLTGLFQEKPQVGYVWKNSFGLLSNSNSKFFWDAPDVQWQPGFVHPNFNVQAGYQKGTWVALPGYVLTGIKEGDLSTMWKSGQKHPDMNAYSTTTEGKWIPALGYKFIMVNGLATGTNWQPGLQYDGFKIYSGEKQDTYYPYPGYLFHNPETSLDVVWTPGLTNPNNSNEISGAAEGSWETNQSLASTETEPTTDEFFGRYFAGHAVATLMEKIFGSNSFSDKLHEESSIEGIKGVIQAIK